MALAPQQIRTYFVTFVSAGRRRLFQKETNAELMLEVFETNRAKARMDVHAFALMPDHVHLLLTPAPEVSLEKAIQFLKGGFSFRLKSAHEVWERGYNEHRIRDRDAFEGCLQYIHQNPVRARLTERAEAYPYSSAALSMSVDPPPEWVRAGQG